MHSLNRDRRNVLALIYAVGWHCRQLTSAERSLAALLGFHFVASELVVFVRLGLLISAGIQERSRRPTAGGASAHEEESRTIQAYALTQVKAFGICRGFCREYSLLSYMWS